MGVASREHSRALRPEALLIIDMINTFQFRDGDRLLGQATRAARVIEKLRDKFRRRSAAVIYANDNFGKWRSQREAVIRRCCAASSPGYAIAQRLRPGEDDYFILKPNHSAFYATPLDLLLKDLGVRSLTITGVATPMCVLLSAYDAHMRGYRVLIPKDAVAAATSAQNRMALGVLANFAKIKMGREL